VLWDALRGETQNPWARKESYFIGVSELLPLEAAASEEKVPAQEALLLCQARLSEPDVGRSFPCSVKMALKESPFTFPLMSIGVWPCGS
jgi:hypothetical protein